MTSPIRVAIVGSGYGLNVLLPAFSAVPAFRVVAPGGRDPSKLRVPDEHGCAGKIHSSLQQIESNPAIDAVALALPPLEQARWAGRLLESGKHLFCEKPLAASLAGATAIAETSQRTGRRVVVDFGFRFVDAFREFHRLIQSRALGSPRRVEVEWLLATRSDPALTWNWKSDAAMGGGTLFLMGSHVLDYLMWFLGPIQKSRGSPTIRVARRPDAGTGLPKAVTADDTCDLALDFAEGVRATVRLSTAMPVNGNHRIRVHCEKGWLELANQPGDDYYDGFQIAADACGIAASTAPPERPGRREIARRVVSTFADCLLNPHVTDPSLEAALAVQHHLKLGPIHEHVQ